MSKVVQYELWQDCNNQCVYCTLGHNNKTPNDFKIESIKKVKEQIRNVKKGDICSLGLIGGEFFQGQLINKNVKNEFFDLIKLINTLLNEEIINEFWLNATLTIGNQKDLYAVLNLIDKQDKIWVLTSYDSKGRFHTKSMLTTWDYNMKKLSEQYPKVNKNTTTIITGDFINQYISDNFDLNLFSMTYKTSIFLKTPVKPDDKCNMSKKELNELFQYEFFPKEIEFMKFLIKYKEREGDFAFQNLFSNNLKADDVHKNYNNLNLYDVIFHRTKDYNEYLNCDRDIKGIETLKCGHSSIYQCFVDSDNCAICSKELILNL